MRICHLITRMIQGGAQENTLLTLEGLCRDTSWDIELAYGPEVGEEGSLLDRANALRISLRPLRYLKRDLNLWDDLKAFQELQKYFCKENFDLVHTHSSKAGVLGRIAARRAGVPRIVHTIHGLAFDEFRPGWRNWIYRTAERMAASKDDPIVVVCQNMADRACAERIGHPSMFRTIYSGFDLTPYLNIKPRRSDGRFVVGMIARMVEHKGYEDFMNLAPQLLERWHDLDFLMVGDGPLRQELDLWLKSYPHWEGRFHFAGRVPSHKIPEQLEQMDMLLHLSWREGLARVIPQALAAKKPVCTYNVGGASEVIQNGKTGWIVPTRDLKKVVDAVEEIKLNSGLTQKMAASGREQVVKLFSVETMQREILRLYQEMGMS